MEYYVVIYYINHNTLRMGPNDPLAYAMGLEYHHPTISMIGRGSWRPIREIKYFFLFSFFSYILLL